MISYKKVFGCILFVFIISLYAAKCSAQDFSACFNNKGIVSRMHKVDSAKKQVTTFDFYNGNPLTANVISGSDTIVFFVTAPKELFFQDDGMKIDIYKGYFSAAGDEYAGALFLQFEDGQISIIYILLTDKQYIFYNAKD